MKKSKLLILVFGLAVTGFYSCKKSLDINTNPNRATSSTPELILPQAITATASMLTTYNSYGAQTGMYAANAGGYGGFGTAITYNYAQGDWNGLWTAAYDNLNDYQACINYAGTDKTYDYFKAAALIMKAHGFQLLVDTYNDVPYSGALKGAENLNPKYDDAKVIYKDLAAQLDNAIALINGGSSVSGIKPLGGSDVLFKGDVAKWKQLANTLKLRLMVHANGKVTFANTSFDGAGFLTTDALINPGYTRDNGKQNPLWNSWVYSYTGSDANKAWMPSTFILPFYNGTKLVDPARGGAIYYQFPTTPTNRLGFEGSGIASTPSGSFWYAGSDRGGTTSGNATGILKGPNAGLPLITAAESYFLQSEASMLNIIPSGTEAASFNAGMLASFKYIFMLPDGSTSGNPTSLYNTYLTNNSTNPLVNFSLATTTAQKLEAIITQKYVALNFVNSNEAWNEYRRTHYPTIVTTTGATGIQTFSSTVSQSTAPDHLPTRVYYPTSESVYNTANVPSGINVYSSKIFWAL